MATKVVPSKCPTCGASLPVPLGAQQVTCRYCQAVIQIEHKRPPPQVIPFGVPGGMPSRTLYLDPKIAEQMAKAGKGIGCFVALMTLLPIVIVAGVAGGPSIFRATRGSVRPFPIACSLNEELTLSGNYEGQGPLVTSAGHNCKLHIKDAKLKGSSLVDTESYNAEITLENVTIETTDVAIHTGSNLKLRLVNSSIVSAKDVIDTDSNLELTVEGSTLESKNAAVLKTTSNAKVKLDGAKLRGKEAAFDTESGFKLTMKQGSEVSATGGPAIKTTSGFDLEAEDGTITSASDVAIETDSNAELTFTNTTVQGTEGIKATSNTKLKAKNKTRIIGLTSFAMTTGGNSVIELTEASLEGGGWALQTDSNAKLKLGKGASVVGKKGGVELNSNGEIDATFAVLDGGSGPGIATRSNQRISFKNGKLSGNPALKLMNRPLVLDLDGTQVVGARVVPTR